MFASVYMLGHESYWQSILLGPIQCKLPSSPHLFQAKGDHVLLVTSNIRPLFYLSLSDRELSVLEEQREVRKVVKEEEAGDAAY